MIKAFLRPVNIYVPIAQFANLSSFGRDRLAGRDVGGSSCAGLAYEKRLDLAAEQYKAALTLDPQNRGLREAFKRLQKN